MKRFLALALAAILVMGLASCGKQSATQSGQSSGSSSQSSSSNKNSSQSGGSSGSQSSNNKNDSGKKVATAAQLVAALEKAGYMVEEDLFDVDDPLVEYDFRVDISEERYFLFGRFKGDIEEDGLAIYLSFTDENSAKFFYEELKDELGAVEESSGNGYAKAMLTTEYGDTYIVSRVKDTVIFIEVDWYDYQDSDTPYDHAAQKAIESLGY